MSFAKRAGFCLGMFAFMAIVWAQEDLVGFPRDYEKTFRFSHVFNNRERPNLREVWINPTGDKTEPGKEFPYGTVIVMLSYQSKTQDGKPLKDESGLYLKGALSRIDVMRKEKGYGTRYGENRSGEWEYNAYRPSGDLVVGDTARCATCHLDASGTDYVFTAEQLTKR
jgi:hypothetical protein